MMNRLNTTVKQLALMCAVLAVTGCNTLQEKPKPTEPPAEIRAAVQQESGIRFDTSDPRIAQLWSAAEQARLEQQLDKALEHLFNALEISPTNSLLWSRAAEIELLNKQASLAENFAVKSNSFAAQNESLLHRNWLIIEHARSLRGDLLGVRSAHKKVQEYQYQ